MRSILAICEGNVCRSPMAEGLLRAALPDVVVASAGFGAHPGMPADPLAVRLLLERNIDINAHRAVRLHAEMCMRADVILVMETGQKRRVEALFPPVRGRVFRLNAQQEVLDPYRQPESVFRSALALIEQGVQEWSDKIRRIRATAS